MRMIWMALLAVAALGGLGAWARHLYWSDFRGVRTAWARRDAVSYEGKDLSGQNLQGAFLPYANFRRAKLDETILSEANVQYADFTGADFQMAGLSDTNFSHAVLHQAKLQNARWVESAIYRGASFRQTDLSWVSFHGLYGRHRLSEAKHMMDPTAGGADLTGAMFDGANCQHTIFSRCLLRSASFQGSDCREASFQHADLRGADFTDADLRGARLDGADLTGAIFRNTRRD